tara:strand:- start:1829 stop:2770 length:942 start_codon:yes stop_codon:yes gene_type:complete
MGKGSGGGEQVQRMEPSELQVPYLTNLYSQAQGLYDGGPQQFYSGNTIAQPTDLQLQGENSARLAALNQQQQVAGSLLPAIQNQLAGPQNVANNPYLAGAATAAIRPVYQQSQALLQQARRGANEAGQLNSDRQALLEQGVIGDYMTKAGDISAGMYNSAYENALRTQAASIQSVPTAMSSLMTPSQSIMGLGGLQTQRAQQGIDSARERFEFEQQAPYEAINQYGNIVAGTMLPGTSTMTGGGEGGGLGTGGAIGGLAGGAAGLGMLGGTAGSFLGQTAAQIGGGALGGTGLAALGGPMGMAAGMLLGSLFD